MTMITMIMMMNKMIRNRNDDQSDDYGDADDYEERNQCKLDHSPFQLTGFNTLPSLLEFSLLNLFSVSCHLLAKITLPSYPLWYWKPF